MTEIETPPLEQHLAEVISSIIREKETSGTLPAMADMVEITSRVNQDVKDSLNAMVKSGLLTFHRTLNSLTFEFTPPK